jgi:DNA-binding GntR family transcriptional regulator
VAEGVVSILRTPAVSGLQGEGFVVINRNRGASVRSIDESFVRNIYEITALIEPYLTQWFADHVTDEDIRRLEDLQDKIENRGFEDPEVYSAWDEKFHRVAHDRHYNQEAVALWERKRAYFVRSAGRCRSASPAARRSYGSTGRSLRRSGVMTGTQPLGSSARAGQGVTSSSGFGP